MRTDDQTRYLRILAGVRRINRQLAAWDDLDAMLLLPPGQGFGGRSVQPIREPFGERGIRLDALAHVLAQLKPALKPLRSALSTVELLPTQRAQGLSERESDPGEAVGVARS